MNTLKVEQVVQALRNQHKGSYQKIKYISKGKDGSYKVVERTFRMINYKPVNETPTKTIEIVKENEFVRVCKNGNRTIMLYGTNNKNHKTKQNYYNINGEEMTKEAYETINKPREYKEGTNPQRILSVNAEMILQIGNIKVE